MSTPAPARDLLAELAALPEHVVGEIVEGSLYASPRPASLHARAASRVMRELGPPFDRGGPGGWVLLFEPELWLGDAPDVLVPDVAGWRRERMPELPDVAHFTLAPDWVCEVLSPSTQQLDRAKKLAVYRRECVRNVWLIDAEAKLLEVYRLAGELYQLAATHAEDVLIHAEPFEAFELQLGLLWER